MQYKPDSIEPKWQAKWEKAHAYRTPSDLATLKQKPKLEYILDISIPSISNHHRLSFKTEADDILKSHCLNEKDNNFDSYDLEYKKLLNRYDITDYNIRINLKNEYQETNDEIKKQFYYNYKKFVKEYRFKKRYSYQLNNFTIDISIVKSNKSRNIVIANLSDVLENYEIEIECNKVNINLILSSILKYMTAFIQISNNSYFITKVFKSRYFTTISIYVKNIDLKYWLNNTLQKKLFLLLMMS